MVKFASNRGGRLTTRYSHVVGVIALVVCLAFLAAQLQPGRFRQYDKQALSLRLCESSAEAASLPETCAQPAAVNQDLLGQWGCRLFRDACLDQGRMLLHSGEKTPGHVNWTDGPLFTPAEFAAYLLPGYPEPLGTAHYMPPTWALDIRAPTLLDPHDVWQPASFNNCTVPLIFWPHYLTIYSDFYSWRLNQLFKMREDGVVDENVTFVVNSNGMDLPGFYQTLLEPFTKNKVMSLADISSRQRMDQGRSRCFSQLLLCNLEYVYGYNKQAGRKIVEYYKEKHPEAFEAHEDRVFRVAFFNRENGMRRILNLDEVLRNCSSWQPPAGSRFTSVECNVLDDFTPDNFVDSLARLQRVQALVSPHGSGVANAFFLPENSAVVEIIAWNFCGYWPDQYHKWGMEDDQSINTGYFRIRADRDHVSPGKYEKLGIGSSVVWARDVDIRLEFGVLAQALQKIALGEVLSVRNSDEGRVFNMVRDDPCP